MLDLTPAAAGEAEADVGPVRERGAGCGDEALRGEFERDVDGAAPSQQPERHGEEEEGDGAESVAEAG